jgi:hypothetical protein
MKKAWTTPALANHGTVEQITTKKVASKSFGNGDDFAKNLSTVDE